MKRIVAFSTASHRIVIAAEAMSPVIRRAVIRVTQSGPSPEAFHLGVDVSGSHVGIALLSTNGSCLESALCSSKPKETLWDFASNICSTIHSVVADRQLASVTVEEALKRFAVGRFSAQGVYKLAQLNAIIVHELRKTGAPVRLATPNAVRSLWDVPLAVHAAALANEMGDTQSLVSMDAIGMSVPRAPASANATKVAVMHLVTRAFPALVGVWGRGPRSGLALSSNFDRSDAVLLAMFGAALHAEESCIRLPEVFEEAAQAAMTELLPRRGVKGLIGTELVARLCSLHAASLAEILTEPDLNKEAEKLLIRRCRKRALSSSADVAVPRVNVGSSLITIPRFLHEGAVYTRCRAAFQQAVVDSMLSAVWTADTAVVDASPALSLPLADSCARRRSASKAAQIHVQMEQPSLRKRRQRVVPSGADANATAAGV
jgi:hypothetical protein